MDQSEISAIAQENEKLISQLLEFTDEMETRLGFLKQKDKKNTTNYTVNTNKDLQEKMNKL